MQTENRNYTVENIQKRIFLFFLFAFLGGGLFPIGGVYIADTVGWANIVPSNYQILFNVISFASVTILATIIILSYRYYKVYPLFSTYLLYFGSIFSIGTLHLLVHMTGGSMQSLFAFHYMFIPAVVAITFTGRWGLIISSGASFTSCFFNLFENDIPLLQQPFFKSSDEWNNIIISKEYRIAFFSIFALQLIIAVCTDMLVEKRFKDKAKTCN